MPADAHSSIVWLAGALAFFFVQQCKRRSGALEGSQICICFLAVCRRTPQCFGKLRMPMQDHLAEGVQGRLLHRQQDPWVLQMLLRCQNEWG